MKIQKSESAGNHALTFYVVFLGDPVYPIFTLRENFITGRDIDHKRNSVYMKTVTIYTDGGTAHRAGVRMSGRLAPFGATGVHGQQTPSEGGLT